MDLLGIGAIAQAIGNVVGTGIQAKQSQKNVELTNKANRELAEYGYSKDLEQWNRANLYNAPTMQMQRLKAAGLNPRLIYGQSSGGAAGQAATSPRYQAPRMDYTGRKSIGGAMLSSIPSMIEQYQGLEMNKAQIDNVKAKTEGEQIKNGISELNRRMKHQEYTWRSMKRVFRDDKTGTIANMSHYDMLSDFQLTALERNNAVKAQQLQNLKTTNALNAEKQKLTQFDRQAWERLSKIGGKEMQFALPFLRLFVK